MGMGEPLHNYDATARALRLLTHRDGIGLSTRRVTVTTSGLIPEIARLGEDFHGQIGLAISLHAPTDEARSRLMPINRRYPLSELLAALKAYPLPNRRRITIEYTLVNGQNDAVEDARLLARLLVGSPGQGEPHPDEPHRREHARPPRSDRRSCLPARPLRRRLLVLHPSPSWRRRERSVRPAGAPGREAEGEDGSVIPYIKVPDLSIGPLPIHAFGLLVATGRHHRDRARHEPREEAWLRPRRAELVHYVDARRGVHLRPRAGRDLLPPRRDPSRPD